MNYVEPVTIDLDMPMLYAQYSEAQPQQYVVPQPQGVQPLVQPQVPLNRRLQPNPNSAKTNSDITGLDSFYSMVGVSAAQIMDTKKDPAGSGDISEARFAVGLNTLLGWGPITFFNVTSATHYSYEQNWATDFAQVDLFLNNWLGSPSKDTFIFPTKTLIRTHELTNDTRSTPLDLGGDFALQTGVLSRLGMKRQGSRFLGESIERAETIRKYENMVPYFLVQYEKTLRMQLSMPFRTEINLENPNLTNATYSWSSTGRGKVFSFVGNFEIALQRIASVVYADAYLYKFKYAALPNDFNRLGFSMAFDFPIYSRLRLTPKLTYFQDKYYLPKVRIAGDVSTNDKKPTDYAQQIDRIDNKYNAGAAVYFDLDSAKRHRIYGDFSYSNTISAINEYNTTSMIFSGGYVWSLPNVSQVKRRFLRFREDTYAGEF